MKFVVTIYREEPDGSRMFIYRNRDMQDMGNLPTDAIVRCLDSLDEELLLFDGQSLGVSVKEIA